MMDLTHLQFPNRPRNPFQPEISLHALFKQADRDQCHLIARVVDICDELDDRVVAIRIEVRNYIKEISRKR